MKFILSSLALAALAQATYPITGTTVNCRSGPSTDAGIVRTYKKDDQVTIVCQTNGPEVNGNSIWDKTSDGCFVTDYFVKTGSSKFVADKCGSSSSSAAASTSVTAAPTSAAASTTVAVPTGGNSTVIPTGSLTSTGGAATSTAPVPAGAAVDVASGLFAAVPLLMALF
ncbi:hypothetical protein VFPPC_09883 [Pochonia chlamydosporia 170]|uniref:Uncharacterized protein n=1 Tax=Pochonia chlamydosporia 170 TaxID=1380566 RepID=A0A179FDG5_METCM|nr:hypothetical protein VFPPC_09883 [Pochonia chlamydosporia 170]OAQ63417.1 hypothetical protein VFPPC_09883 [Pochonia chlamydosporia 170]